MILGGNDKAAPVVRLSTDDQPAPIVDVASGTVTYKGYAPLGTSTADALWQILKITISGAVTTTEYADGNMLFDNIWASRASLNYSR